MAQPVFEAGPLEQYLRDAGEATDLMPGISQEIVQEIDLDRDYYDLLEEDMEWRPNCLVIGLNLLDSFLSSTHPSQPTNPFVEKFKYSVISSSLLSSSSSHLHHGHGTRSSLASSVSLPGKLTDDSPNDFSDSSLPDQTEQPTTTTTAAQNTSQPPPNYAYFSIAALAAALLLSLERRWLATLSLGGISVLAYNLMVTSEMPCHDFTPTIDDLVEANRIWESTIQDSFQILEKEESHLLRSPPSHSLSSSTSSSSSLPTNALRVALHSTLQTTRNQCDNVRQLFSALTSPAELAPLSEMYAPPSPVRSPLLLPAEGGSSSSGHGYGGGAGFMSPRPYSFPTRETRGGNAKSPTTPENKRATWAGSSPALGTYTSLAGMGSPTSPFRRREITNARHRTNLSALFEGGSPTPSTATGSLNTPVTPFQMLGMEINPVSMGMGSLAQVAEDLHASSSENDAQVVEYPTIEDGEEEQVFGSTALDLQKKRMGAFELGPLPTPPEAHSPAFTDPPHTSSSRQRSPSFAEHMRSPAFGHTMRSPGSASTPGTMGRHSHRVSTFTSSSRFTSIQPPRHPLSLFALNQALQAALLSRRYTCSHLLALRFTDDSRGLGEDREEKEEYWENVKSVVELLTVTFVDEAARLGEALEDVERQRMRDSNPTPDISGEFPSSFSSSELLQRFDGPSDMQASLPSSSSVELLNQTVGGFKKKSRRTASYDRVSFAPMPSHLSRFAAHVAAISGALEDAREQLEEVVAALKEDHLSDPSPLAHRRAASSAVHGRRRSSLSISVKHPGRGEEEEEEEHRALQAYERLRRELGMALRECERGRQRLVEVVHPPFPSFSDDDDEDELDGGVPPLGHDTSDDSDKPEPHEDSEDLSSNSHSHGGVQQLVVGTELDPSEAAVDDVTAHLLLRDHLEPIGVEQVYEADTGLVGVFSRERSKLSREERIRLARARRESSQSATSGGAAGFGLGLGIIAESDGPSLSHDAPGRNGAGRQEKWGPGGEVVQELKDVIWKVGERRRKMMERAQRSQSLEMQAMPQTQSQAGHLEKDAHSQQEDESILPSHRLESGEGVEVSLS